MLSQPNGGSKTLIAAVGADAADGWEAVTAGDEVAGDPACDTAEMNGFDGIAVFV